MFRPWSLDGVQISLLEKSYAELKQSVYDGLALQTRLKPYLDQVSLTLDETGINVDFAALEAKLDTLYVSDPANALVDRIELMKYAGTGLQALGWEGGRAKLSGWIEAAQDQGWWEALRTGLGAPYQTPSGEDDVLLGRCDKRVCRSAGLTATQTRHYCRLITSDRRRFNSRRQGTSHHCNNLGHAA